MAAPVSLERGSMLRPARRPEEKCLPPTSPPPLFSEFVSIPRLRPQKGLAPDPCHPSFGGLPDRLPLELPSFRHRQVSPLRRPLQQGGQGGSRRVAHPRLGIVQQQVSDGGAAGSSG